MPHKPESCRRWFQISLRTVLLLVTLASGAFGWLGHKFRQAKSQREAVYAIQRLGGCQFAFDFEGQPPGPLWLRNWMDDDYLFANATGITWSGHLATDETIILLQALPELKMLYLHDTLVTDAGLANLRASKQLVTLKISRMPITDAGLVHIRELTELEELTIDETRITKQGCQELQKFLPNAEIDSDVLWQEETKP